MNPIRSSSADSSNEPSEYPGPIQISPFNNPWYIMEPDSKKEAICPSSISFFNLSNPGSTSNWSPPSVWANETTNSYGADIPAENIPTRPSKSGLNKSSHLVGSGIPASSNKSFRYVKP